MTKTSSAASHWSASVVRASQSLTAKASSWLVHHVLVLSLWPAVFHSEPESNQKATRKQPESNQAATRQQPGSKHEASRKQPGSNHEATRKQTGSNQEATRKQPGSQGIPLSGRGNFLSGWGTSLSGQGTPPFRPGDSLFQARGPPHVICTLCINSDLFHPKSLGAFTTREIWRQT